MDGRGACLHVATLMRDHLNQVEISQLPFPANRTDRLLAGERGKWASEKAGIGIPSETGGPPRRPACPEKGLAPQRLDQHRDRVVKNQALRSEVIIGTSRRTVNTKVPPNTTLL